MGQNSPNPLAMLAREHNKAARLIRNYRMYQSVRNGSPVDRVARSYGLSEKTVKNAYSQINVLAATGQLEAEIDHAKSILGWETEKQDLSPRTVRTSSGARFTPL